MEERLEERAGRAILGAIGPEEQEDGGVGGSEQLGDQGGAIDVAPLEVVDGQDQRRPVAQPGQQLTQGREGATAQLLGVRALEDPARGLGPGLDLPQAGEDPRQRGHVPRQEGRDFGFRQVPQVPPERVDQAIEGLVGDRLSLVAAAGQDDGVAPLDPLVQEAPEQRRLAGTRVPVEVEDHGAASGHRGQGLIERLAMAAAADQGRALTVTRR